MYQPINGFTKAKILDVIRARAFTAAAVNAAGTCVYLADNGNKCAVGMFIPDGHAGQEQMGYAGSLLDSYPDLVQVMPLSRPALISFQGAHDAEAESAHTHQQPFQGNAKAAMIAWVEKNVSDDNTDRTAGDEQAAA